MVTVWAALLPLLLASAAVAEDFSGPVVFVLEGDTIEVLHNEHPERIRLKGIDCQEKGQAYSNNAKHAASELVFGKESRSKRFGKDKSWRTIGEVTLPDGADVNHTYAGERWLVLGVSKVCAGEYGIRGARDRSTRGAKRVVG